MKSIVLGLFVLAVPVMGWTGSLYDNGVVVYSTDGCNTCQRQSDGTYTCTSIYCTAPGKSGTDLHDDAIQSPPILADVNAVREVEKRDGPMTHVLLYEYDEQREVWNRARPSSCLATMQAAMEAMDPFIGGGLVWHKEYVKDPSENELRTRLKVRQQWEAAKACWK